MGIEDLIKIILPLGILMSSSVSLTEKSGREKVCKGKSTPKTSYTTANNYKKKINNDNPNYLDSNPSAGAKNSPFPSFNSGRSASGRGGGPRESVTWLNMLDELNELCLYGR